MDDDGEQVEGFQVHLGGATGLQANFGRKLRAHKVTSAGLDDYVTTVVTNFLADREPTTSRSRPGSPAPTRILLRGEKATSVGGEPLMSERAVPFHCPYCGEEDLCPHAPTRTPATARGNAAPACAPSRVKMLGSCVPPQAVADDDQP